MAETLGAVSACVGIVAFVLQVTTRIEDLKILLRFTPAEVAGQLVLLSARLELFHAQLKRLQSLDSDPEVELAVQQSSSRFRDVEHVVQQLQRKFLPKGHALSGRRHKLKLIVTRKHVLEQIENAKDSITEMSDDITRQVQTSVATVVAHRSDPSLGKLGDPAMVQKSTICIEHAIVKTASVLERQNQRISRRIHHQHCGPRHCDCLCHLKGKKSGSFWSLEYTPLSILLKKPVTGRCCSSQFCLNLRLALSSYGIPLAIVAGLNITTDAIGLTLRPALRTERIVEYTSPGFETLLRLEHCDISFAEAQAKFVELYRLDSTFRHHRDPSGQSYLQRLLEYPWSFRSGDQLKLLRMFVDQFHMSLADQDSSFLTTCAGWIGEGPHLDLLDAILECGFDPTVVNSPLWEQWPQSCSPNWISEEDTPDPFFVEYLATLVKDDPTFSGSTPVCNAVLTRSDKDVEAWLSNSQPLEESTTFLGQSPLHLAVTKPSVCHILLDAGHALDVTDKWGATPLMYAAAMGEKQTVALLLSRGANPTIQQRQRPYDGGRKGRTFVDYAIVRGHLDLVVDALSRIGEIYGREARQAWSQLAVMVTISTGRPFTDCRAALFSELVKNLAGVNISFTDNFHGVDDNNLMHYVQSVEDASALVRCGFDQFNNRNSDGKLAINSLARHRDPALIKFCIDNGTGMGNKDNQGRTILFDLFFCLTVLDDWKACETLDAIRLCLDAGVDIFEKDNCRCPCSPDGCTMSGIFSTDFLSSTPFESRPGLLWSLEWVTLVEEHRGVEAARRVLLSLLRRAKCDQADIAINHVCCHRGRGISRRRIYGDQPRTLADDDIAEILDEESEFIDILRIEMEQLASDSLLSLRSRWMSVIKAKYNAHVEAVNKARAESKPQLPKGYPRNRFHVDSKNDTYVVNLFYIDKPSAYSMTRSVSSYGFWLQYEYERADDSPLRKVRKSGWFERRVAWVTDLIDMMALLANEIKAETARLQRKIRREARS